MAAVFPFKIPYKKHKGSSVHVRRLHLTDITTQAGVSYIEDDGSGNLKVFNSAGVGVSLDATKLGLIDGLTPGTVIASKAVTVDANKDTAGIRNLTISGNLVVAGPITLSAAELGVLDAVVPGTALASSAVVLDANKQVSGVVFVAASASKTADYPLVAADNGKHFDNTGAAGSVNFTLSAVASSAGFSMFIHQVVDQPVVITAPAGTLVGPNNAGRTSYTSAGAGNRIGVDIRAYCNGAKWFLMVDLKGLTIGTYA